jgi:hypothetical protein
MEADGTGTPGYNEVPSAVVLLFLCCDYWMHHKGLEKGLWHSSAINHKHYAK